MTMAMTTMAAMTPAEGAALALAAAQGAAMGALYFGALWWSVRALAGGGTALPLAALLLRLGALAAGFWLVAGGDWRRLLACLLGLMAARAAAVRLARREPRHAP